MDPDLAGLELAVFQTALRLRYSPAVFSQGLNQRCAPPPWLSSPLNFTLKIFFIIFSCVYVHVSVRMSMHEMPVPVEASNTLGLELQVIFEELDVVTGYQTWLL